MRTRLSLLIVLMIFATVFTSFAEDTPAKTTVGGEEGEMFLGVEVGGSNFYGFTGTYGLTNDFQIGLNFGFIYNGAVGVQKSTTALLFAPYGRMFLNKMKSFRPFVQATFVVNSGSSNYYNPNTAQYETQSHTSTGIHGALGLHWKASKNCAIYGGLNIIEIQLDPSQLIIGTNQPFIGIEWNIF